MFSNQEKQVKNQSGLTLIEMGVALSIITIAFIGLIQVFPFGLSINKGGRNTTIASYLAQSKIEELHSLGYDNISTGTVETKQRLSTDPSSYLYNFYRETVVNYVNSNLQVESADQGMKRISVTVYYTEPLSKTEKTYNITTLISQR